MRKLSIIMILILAVAFQYCSSSKKLKASKSSISYSNNVQNIIVTKCSPCHFPPKGNKKPLDSYDAVRSNIDEILSRVQRNPGDKGFMPAFHPKLSDSTINVLIAWKNNGTPQ
jgi:cytochrome c553